MDSNEQRLYRLDTICNQNPGTFKAKTKRRPYLFNTLIDIRHQVLYCQIQKAGSTFWKKTLFNYTLPGTKHVPSLKSLKTSEDKFRSDFFKFFFVRDPYHRLFSGYVDKLFNPNAAYWKITGVQAKSLSHGTRSDFQCGHDVTFAEFIDYVIAVERTPDKRDRHFFSMYEHCEPCEHKPNFIGKMETFYKDALSIFNHTNIDKTVISKFERMMSNISVTTIISMAKRLFWLKTRILKCMTMYEAVLRIWRNLQIKGILGCNVKFPFTKRSVTTMTQDKFISQLLQSYKASSTDTTRKLNKEYAFSEAYATVPNQTLNKLEQVVRKDCLLFGYNTHPDSVFKARSFINSEFRFLKL